MLKIDGANCVEAILYNSEQLVSAGISLSAFAVFGNDNFSNTSDYTKGFGTVSVGVGKARIIYAYSSCCKTVGAGGAVVGGTAGISVNHGYAYYQLLDWY